MNGNQNSSIFEHLPSSTLSNNRLQANISEILSEKEKLERGRSVDPSGNEDGSSKLLAWSTWSSNKISICSTQTKEEYATFDGPQLRDGGWTLVQNIPDLSLIISSHHNRSSKCMRFELFDISRKKRPKQVFSFTKNSETAKGDLQPCDVAYHKERGWLAILPIKSWTSYHLFQIADGDSSSVVSLLRKTKWLDQQSKTITSLDFDSQGKNIASLDLNGMILISSVEDPSSTVNMQLEQKIGMNYWSNHCRWGQAEGSTLLYITYDTCKLNVFEAEKKIFIFKNSLRIQSQNTGWIDVCKSDPNLVAIAGFIEQDVKIYDQRRKNILKSINKIHLDYIYTAKWSPDGSMLATSSADGTAKAIDFSTGKVIFSEKSLEKNLVCSACFI